MAGRVVERKSCHGRVLAFHSHSPRAIARNTTLNYTEPQPIEPEDERAKLHREFIEASKQMARLAERIERIAAPAVRSIA